MLKKLIQLITKRLVKPINNGNSGAPASVVIPENVIATAPEPKPTEQVTVITTPQGISQAIIVPKDYGLELVKEFEGCRLKAYQDIVGIWTIGYGQTGRDVKEGLVWTQVEADSALEKEYKRFAKIVQDTVKKELNSRQHQALTSFTYNCGERNLQNLIRNRDVKQIGDAILLYDKAGGKAVRGLKIRRLVENRLYNSVLDNKFDVHSERERATQEVTNA